MIALILIALLQIRVPDAEQFVGPPQGPRLEGAQLDRRTAEVAALLRCPVCQGLAVADSPAEMAVNMKKQVRELLARGYTEDQILRYFERSYGEFVLLRPRFEGVNAFVWLLPVAILVAGILVVVRKGRSLAAVPATPAEPAAEDPYLRKVREMVDGK